MTRPLVYTLITINIISTYLNLFLLTPSLPQNKHSIFVMLIAISFEVHFLQFFSASGMHMIICSENCAN